MSLMTGFHHDVIGIDPRGTGKTLPLKCYPNDFDRLHSSLQTPVAHKAFDTALTHMWAGLNQNAKDCYEQWKEEGEIVGTAFVARDLMQVVDTLGEDGMLRYWGQSYGSILAATIAAMFPDCIDRMVIDGIVNPHEWTEGWEYDPVASADVALHKLLESCVNAGQPNCSLARPNATVESLTAQIFLLIEEVKRQPIIMGSNASTEFVGINELMESFNNPLRVAISYAIPLTGYLNAIMERNVSAYHIYRFILFPNTTPFPLSADANTAIRCSDATLRSDNLTKLIPRIDKMQAKGRLTGDYFTSGPLLCAL